MGHTTKSWGRLHPLQAFAVLALFGAARAEAFDAQAFSPAIDPNGYFSVYSSETAPQQRFHLAVWYNYADQPVLRPELVDPLHTIDLVGSFSLLSWLEVGFDLPISDPGTSAPGVLDDMAVDNLRLMMKVSPLPHRLGGFGIAIVPFVDLPSGEHRSTTGQKEDVNGGGVAVLDFAMGRFRAAVNGGYLMNQRSETNQFPPLNDGGDQILFGLGLGFMAVKGESLGLELLAEGFGSTEAKNPFDNEFITPAEGVGGVQLLHSSGVYFKAGGGKSITDSINGASWRIIGTLGFTPPPPPPPPPPAPAPPPPPPPLPQVVQTDEQIITLAPIYFDFDRDTIKQVSHPVLDQVAAVMQQRPTAVVRVEGHTDSFGSDDYNQKLSERRAQAVVRYLVGKDIDGSRLEAQGFGESRPIETNETAEGRAKNRRTEFHIIRETR